MATKMGPKTKELVEVLAKLEALLDSDGEQHWRAWLLRAKARSEASDSLLFRGANNAQPSDSIAASYQYCEERHAASDLNNKNEQQACAESAF